MERSARRSLAGFVAIYFFRARPANLVKLNDNCCTATICSRPSQLLRDSSFDAIAKMLFESATRFNPGAVQEALGPVQDDI